MERNLSFTVYRATGTIQVAQKINIFKKESELTLAQSKKMMYDWMKSRCNHDVSLIVNNTGDIIIELNEQKQVVFVAEIKTMNDEFVKVEL